MHNIATHVVVKYNRKRDSLNVGSIINNPMIFDCEGEPHTLDLTSAGDSVVYLNEGVIPCGEYHYVPVSSLVDLINENAKERVMEEGDEIEVDSVEEARDIVMSQEKHLSSRNILKAAFTIEKEKGKVVIKRLA